MPFVNVKLVEGLFTEEQKQEMAQKLTDVMAECEGSAAFRESVVVLIEELQRDGWHIGGAAYPGPTAFLGTFARMGVFYDGVNVSPRIRDEEIRRKPVFH